MLKNSIRYYAVLLFFVLILLGGINSYMLYQERYIAPDKVPLLNSCYDYAGNVHLHTVYSDGGGDFEKISGAAANTGLTFLLTADHNTIEPFRDSREGWRNNVLILTGVEISSSVGHIVFYDGTASYKNYDPQIVESLLNSHNEFNDTLLFLAHPYHPRMPFTEWRMPGIRGMEIFNGDVQWRDDSVPEIISALAGAVFFPDAANHLIDYPAHNLKKWDELLKEKPVYGIGASDAHSNIKVSKSWHIGFPSYETLFSFVKTHVLTREPLRRNLHHDRNLVVNALRKGNSYIELGNLCNPAGFLFTVARDSGFVLPGDSVTIRTSARFVVQSPDSAGVLIRLLMDGRVISESSNTGRLDTVIHDSGVFRAEVFQVRKLLPGFPPKKIPWILSNPIFIRKKETN